MARATGFTSTLPHGGLRSALPGGNTIGGWCREAEPRADGHRHVDTPAMIARLTEVGANHFFFGVWDSPTDWDDLRTEFAPAALRADIQVTPYLVPPSETFEAGRASEPHRMDYLAWATEVAELSLACPNVTSWAIDDFDIGDNSATFTDDYLARIRAAAAAINPDLGFLTCAYYGSATSTEFLDRYAHHIDAVIYPYLDGANSNTVVSSSVTHSVDAVLAATAPYDLAVITLLYAGRFLDGVASPTEDYVSNALEQILAIDDERHLGVVAYGLQTDGAPTPATENRAMYGTGRGALASSPARATKGDWAELSCRVRIDPEWPRHELSFWSSRQTHLWRVPRRGELHLQVCLDGAPLWSADVHDATWMGLWVQGRDWQGPVDTGWAMRGKESERTLSFRLTALRDLPGSMIDVGLDHLETIGFTLDDPGFESPDRWQVRSSGGPLVAWVDRFVPDRPARILDAVARHYRTPR